jgi:transposase
MFLKCSRRCKDGKEHRTWSIVESRRMCDGSIVQRHVLYLGEINDSQRASWQKSIEVFEDGEEPRQVALFPDDRVGEQTAVSQIQIRLGELSLHRPRQWGACWLGLQLWQELRLDEFWRERLAASREGTRWDLVLTTLALYRLLDPGSEWRLHREWFERCALADLLGQDCRLAGDDTLYRCHDKLLAHKQELFSHLQERWRDLFGARFEVILYDLTSTYFECDVPEDEGLRRFGYSRDKRSDCVQVVIALIVTAEGFPLGYEVLHGATSDKTTLQAMLKKIEEQYGKAARIWLMDRGIPTEEVLAEMRAATPPVSYLVGTPKGRLTKLEAELAKLEWHEARSGVEVKLLTQDGPDKESEKHREVYVLARSRDRVIKERSMRKRRLKKLWERLHELSKQNNNYQELLLKLGAAREKAGVCWKLIRLTLPEPPAKKEEKAKKGKTRTKGTKKKTQKDEVTFQFALDKERLRATRRREGRYLLRSNLCGKDPSQLWQYYMTLTQVEEAFKNLKGDLGLRPVFHRKDSRIEAHIFVSFLAYCLHVTLHRRLHQLAPGLTPRSALEKFASMSMLDVHLPTTDGRTLVLTRYTQPDKDTQLLLEKLKLSLPAQPPPKITAPNPKPSHQKQKLGPVA